MVHSSYAWPGGGCRPEDTRGCPGRRRRRAPPCLRFTCFSRRWTCAAKPALAPKRCAANFGIPRAHARRSLDRALDRVDAHLAGLNANGALDRAELPAAFEIVPLRNGRRLRFVVRDDRAEREEEREDAERRARSDEMYPTARSERTEAEREEAERRASVRAWLARNRLKEATQ